MKAQELRLGNLIYYHIKDKLNEPEEWDAENIVDCFDIAQMVENPETNEYKPIPLTEEWLLKFGFIDVGNVDFLIAQPTKYIASFKAGINDKFGLFAWNNIKLNEIEIKYVHQLQNLYYSLTGTDLTIPVSEKPLSEGEKIKIKIDTNGYK